MLVSMLCVTMHTMKWAVYHNRWQLMNLKIYKMIRKLAIFSTSFLDFFKTFKIEYWSLFTLGRIRYIIKDLKTKISNAFGKNLLNLSTTMWRQDFNFIFKAIWYILIYLYCLMTFALTNLIIILDWVMSRMNRF